MDGNSTRPAGAFDMVPRRVLVLRALQLGDMLCAIPALRAFRSAWPKAEISLLGLPWAREFAKRFCHYIDRFHEFPGWPGLPERPPEIHAIPDFLRKVQRESFDIAVQLHGSGSFVNSLIVLCGARRSAGFFVPGDYCPDPGTFLAWPETGLEIRRLLKLVSFLGLPLRGESLEFPVRPSDYLELQSVENAADLRSRPFACIHAGASIPERRWPAKKFTAVARFLASKGLAVALTGSAAERDLATSIQAACAGPMMNLAGKTNLGSLAALLQSARLLVCNDTGVSHLAAALRVPSVVISTGANPERWAPINHDLHRTLCDSAGVRVEEVILQIDHLLATGERLRAADDQDPRVATESRPQNRWPSQHSSVVMSGTQAGAQP